jgi:glutaredoxin-like protein
VFLKGENQQRVRSMFTPIEHLVQLIVFTKQTDCNYCGLTRDLVQELAGLHDQITTEVHDLDEDKVLAEGYGVDKVPAIVVRGDRDYGIRFYGVPAGYELASLLEAIVDVGKRDHGLPESILHLLAQVDQPVHIQAMVSPTCPHCPLAVRAAHKFAIASDLIRGDMVDITEFTDLGSRYGVFSVPNMVINETPSIVGGQTDRDYAKAVLKAIGR